MANVAAPYGFLPHQNLITGDVNFGVRSIAYTADINRTIAIGDTINIGAGALGIPSATPTTTRGSNSPWGVVKGITFTKGPGGTLLGHANYLPANAVTAGYSGIVIEYWDSPFIIFKLQANANTGASTAVGKNAALVATAATSTGSKIALDASTIATTNTLAVRILGFAPGSSASDTYPDYLVTWTPGVHPTTNATGV